MASGSHVPLNGANETRPKIFPTKTAISPSSVLSLPLASPRTGPDALPHLGSLSLLDEWQGEMDRRGSGLPLPSENPQSARSRYTSMATNDFGVDAEPSANTLPSSPILSVKSPIPPRHNNAGFMLPSIFGSSLSRQHHTHSDASDKHIPQNSQSRASTETVTPSTLRERHQTSIPNESSPNSAAHSPRILSFSRVSSRSTQEARASTSSLKESSASTHHEKDQPSGSMPWPQASVQSHATSGLQYTSETHPIELFTLPAVPSATERHHRQRRLSADISAAEAFHSRGSWQRGVTEQLLKLSEERSSPPRSGPRDNDRVTSAYSRSRLSSLRQFRHHHKDTFDAEQTGRHRALSDGTNGIFGGRSVTSLDKQLGLVGKLKGRRVGGRNIDVLRDGVNAAGPIRVSAFHRASLPAYTKPMLHSESDGPSPPAGELESDSTRGELSRTAVPDRLADISDIIKMADPQTSSSHKVRHHSLPPTVTSNISTASSGNRSRHTSNVNFASGTLEPSTGKRKERGDHDNEGLVQNSVRLVSPLGTLPRGILKSSPPMMPSAFADLSSDRQSKRLKLSLSSPPVAADFSGELISSSRRSLSRLAENNNPSVEQPADFQETSTFPSQPSFGAQSSTVVSHRAPPTSYSPSFSSTRVSSQNDARRTSISSRLTSGGTSIPMRAFLSPRPPSIAGNQLSEYHMQDPSLSLRYSKIDQSRMAPQQVEVLGWWQKPSIHGWCFLVGFIFPPLWWAGAFFLKPRHVVLSRMKDNGLIEEWNDQDQVALTWRFRCRLMSVFSLLIYIPIIVLAVVFGS